ncbi:MAG TPA: transposase, partial [Hanamia sp.]|nr:transposase [Hanamia sp.]
QGKYKYAITSWEDNWDNLSNYFEYPLELRKLICTTNTIKNLNRGANSKTVYTIYFILPQSTLYYPSGLPKSMSSV